MEICRTMGEGGAGGLSLTNAGGRAGEKENRRTMGRGNVSLRRFWVGEFCLCFLTNQASERAVRTPAGATTRHFRIARFAIVLASRHDALRRNGFRVQRTS